MNFASANYLGLSQDARIHSAGVSASRQFGASASSSLLVGGLRLVHKELERAASALVGAEDALLYASGYLAVESTMMTMAQAEDLILYDEFAHLSIREGAHSSHAPSLPFPHNDAKYVDAFLSQFRGRFRRVLLCLESIYTANGDLCDLPAFIALRRRHAVLILMDESHTLGVIGPHGLGAAEHFGINRDDVDVWMGSFAKAFAGSGGFIAGKRDTVTWLRFSSPGHVYSTGMSPVLAATALEAIRTFRAEPWRAQRLQANVRLLHHLLAARGFDLARTGKGGFAGMVLLATGPEAVALRFCAGLRARGVEAVPVSEVDTTKDLSRIRFVLSATHTSEQLVFTANACQHVYENLRATGFTFLPALCPAPSFQGPPPLVPAMPSATRPADPTAPPTPAAADPVASPAIKSPPAPSPSPAPICAPAPSPAPPAAAPPPPPPPPVGTASCPLCAPASSPAPAVPSPPPTLAPARRAPAPPAAPPIGAHTAHRRRRPTASAAASSSPGASAASASSSSSSSSMSWSKSLCSDVAAAQASRDLTALGLAKYLSFRSPLSVGNSLLLTLLLLCAFMCVLYILP